MLFDEALADQIAPIAREIEQRGHRVVLDAEAMASEDLDILHAHDWRTAPAVALRPRTRACTVFTVHHPEASGECDCSKAALLSADAITSPAAFRLQVQGFGLEEVYRRRAARLMPIRNNADSYLSLYRQLLNEQKH